MNRPCQRLVLAFILVLLSVACGWAELDLRVAQNLKLPANTITVVPAENGAKLFVLAAGGKMQILSAAGQVLESFQVAEDATGLSLTPQGDKLFVTRGQGRELQVIELAYVQELPVENSPIKGPENAPVTMTVFSDYQCPYCAKLEPMLDQVMAKYPTQLRMVFKQFPLRMHAFAQPAAIASLAAREQGKFWPMHDKLFANFNQLNDNKIKQLAAEVGLDIARFEKDIQNPAFAQEVARDLQLGQKAGVRGTPTVFINGKLVQQRSLAGFSEMIDNELKGK